MIVVTKVATIVAQWRRQGVGTVNKSKGATETTLPAKGDAATPSASDPFASLCTPEDVNTVYKFAKRLPNAIYVEIEDAEHEINICRL
jgi:hypothetical protein